MVSSQRIPTIAVLCIFKGTIQQVRHLGRGREMTKKATVNDIERRVCSQKSDVPHKILLRIFSVTQSFLLGFSWSSDNITVSKKKSTSKKEPTSIFEITISYLHKNIIIPLLCQCGLFIHVSKKLVVSKDVIFYLLWCNVIQWSSYICGKSFLSFYSFLVKFSE